MVVQELTDDLKAVQEALKRIENREHTRIDLGVAQSHRELNSVRHVAGHRRIIVLLTDGKANPVPVDAAVSAAALAKEDGVEVFAIGFGTESELEAEALRRIASEPHYYYETPDPAELVRIYEDIVGRLPCDRSGVDNARGRLYGGRSHWRRHSVCPSGRSKGYNFRPPCLA
jgi:hypothetical protein